MLCGILGYVVFSVYFNKRKAYKLIRCYYLKIYTLIKELFQLSILVMYSSCELLEGGFDFFCGDTYFGALGGGGLK